MGGPTVVKFFKTAVTGTAAGEDFWHIEEQRQGHRDPNEKRKIDW